MRRYVKEAATMKKKFIYLGYANKRKPVAIFLAALCTCVFLMNGVSFKSSPLSQAFTADSAPLHQKETETKPVGTCDHKVRVSHLDAYCRQHKELIHKHMELRPSTYWRLLVDEEHKIVMCSVPKAGGSSWKMAFSQSLVPDLPPDFDVQNTHLLEMVGLKYLDKYSEKDRRNILENFLKVIVVRHPFDRLVSVWKDKFKGGMDFRGSSYAGHEGKYWRFLKEVIKEKYSKTDHMEFGDFIRYILDTSSPYDKHWELYLNLCHPCLIRYDYILKTETMNEDSNVILDSLSGFNTIKLDDLHNTENASAVSSRSTWFNDSSADEMNKLQKIYQTDFDMFGYSWREGKSACNYGQNENCC